MADVMTVVIVVIIHITGEGQVMSVVIATMVVVMIMVVAVQPRTRRLSTDMSGHTGPHGPGGLQRKHEYQDEEQGATHGGHCRDRGVTSNPLFYVPNSGTGVSRAQVPTDSHCATTLPNLRRRGR